MLSEIRISEKVMDQPEKLNCSQSVGPDGTHPSALKELETNASELLTKICNLSLKAATVPEDRRVAEGVPISLEGVNDDPVNYKPVSLTLV